jgi:hypothetical protein
MLVPRRGGEKMRKAEGVRTVIGPRWLVESLPAFARAQQPYGDLCSVSDFASAAAAVQLLA